MTTAEWTRAIGTIDAAFSMFMGMRPAAAVAASSTLTDGKLYELRVLAWLLTELNGAGYRTRLANGTSLVMRYSPGPIDRSLPYFEVHDATTNTFIGEIWQNVEFLGIGFEKSHRQPVGKGPNHELEPDYHELDIALVVGQPTHAHRLRRQAIAAAVECKDRVLEKSILREILGLRRELTFLRKPTGPESFRFPVYTAITTQDPPIRLFLCWSRALRRNYAAIWSDYAIHVLHLPV